MHCKRSQYYLRQSACICGWISALLWLCLWDAVGAVAGPPVKLKMVIPELVSCEQLVTVTTNGWDNVSATIRLYERSTEGSRPWRPYGRPFPAVIGQRGLAWGVGLHGDGEAGEPQKREGDLKAPAGVFRFGAVFGIATPEQVRFLRLPYHRVAASTEAIDDPKSKFYNQIVDRSQIVHPDWTSSESMLQVGGRYRLGVVIEHNPGAIPGFGSCIFLHVWDPRYSGTTGCTATDYRHLFRLLRWLDPKKRPLMVELPTVEYERLQGRWGLPALRQ
jgi:L,D-peptidoglycan transpeptidase YkuD (ErfK/YbiS/YcfS/YnhG family)